MNGTRVAISALVLTLGVIQPGHAAVPYAGAAVKADIQAVTGDHTVKAKERQGLKSRRSFGHRRHGRHGKSFRHGRRHRFGRRFRHRRHSFAFVFPYYYPYYGYRHYHRHDYPYAPPPAYAQPVPSYAQPTEPAPAPISEQRSYCREIIMDVVIDGVEQQAYVIACREPDGSWKIKN